MENYDLLRSIAMDSVCATEQWARIVKKTTFKSPDAQAKLAFALSYFNDATKFYDITVPPRIVELVIESAVDQRGDKGFSGLSTFEIFRGPLGDDGPDRDKD
jgi:hypothetical protein